MDTIQEESNSYIIKLWES